MKMATEPLGRTDGDPCEALRKEPSGGDVRRSERCAARGAVRRRPTAEQPVPDVHAPDQRRTASGTIAKGRTKQRGRPATGWPGAPAPREPRARPPTMAPSATRASSHAYSWKASRQRGRLSATCAASLFPSANRADSPGEARGAIALPLGSEVQGEHGASRVRALPARVIDTGFGQASEHGHAPVHGNVFSFLRGAIDAHRRRRRWNPRVTMSPTFAAGAMPRARRARARSATLRTKRTKDADSGQSVLPRSAPTSVTVCAGDDASAATTPSLVRINDAGSGTSRSSALPKCVSPRETKRMRCIGAGPGSQRRVIDERPDFDAAAHARGRRDDEQVSGWKRLRTKALGHGKGALFARKCFATSSGRARTRSTPVSARRAHAPKPARGRAVEGRVARVDGGQARSRRHARVRNVVGGHAIVGRGVDDEPASDVAGLGSEGEHHGRRFARLDEDPRATKASPRRSPRAKSRRARAAVPRSSEQGEHLDLVSLRFGVGAGTNVAAHDARRCPALRRRARTRWECSPRAGAGRRWALRSVTTKSSACRPLRVTGPRREGARDRGSPRRRWR